MRNLLNRCPSIFCLTEGVHFRVRPWISRSWASPLAATTEYSRETEQPVPQALQRWAITISKNGGKSIFREVTTRVNWRVPQMMYRRRCTARRLSAAPQDDNISTTRLRYLLPHCTTRRRQFLRFTRHYLFFRSFSSDTLRSTTSRLVRAAILEIASSSSMIFIRFPD